MPSRAPGRPACAAIVRSAKLCSSRDNAMMSPIVTRYSGTYICNRAHVWCQGSRRLLTRGCDWSLDEQSELRSDAQGEAFCHLVYHEPINTSCVILSLCSSLSRTDRKS